MGAKTAALLPYSSAAAPLSMSPPRRSPRSLKHRFITPGFLAGLARLADFAGLALVSVIILSTYVEPRDAGKFGYALASLLLPAATVILIGSFNGYAVGDYRRAIIENRPRRRRSGARVFGCFTLVLFFLKMGEDFSRVWLASWFLGGPRRACRCSASWSAASWRAGSRPACWSAAPCWSAAARRRSSSSARCATSPPTTFASAASSTTARPTASRRSRKGYPRLGRIDELLEFGRQAEIDMLIVALPMAAEAAARAAPEDALGAAGRHPPFGGHHAAALPPALLFLCRLGALPRPLRQADRRLGPRGEVVLRPRRRRADRWCSLRR